MRVLEQRSVWQSESGESSKRFAGGIREERDEERDTGISSIKAGGC